MFSNLVSYLIGSTNSEQPEERVEEIIRLTSRVSEEDDWVLVDRDSEGNSEASSEESLHDRLEDLLDVPATNFGRSCSSSSLPCAHMEESWFITPPPIFTSSGPIEVETSPFENLLIEHPSMSVYHQHSHPLFVPRRQNLVPEPEEDPNSFSDTVAVLRDTEPIVEVPAPRRNRVEAVRTQEERQAHKTKQAQKIQIQKACQSLKRGYLDRNNKAREVNCRNQRLRRGERSQGATRSYANNNRKC